MKIQDFCGYRLELKRAPGDTTTSIAELAQFVDFDPSEARRADTAEHCIAFDALQEAYGGHEMVDGDSDYYDGFWALFADGSKITYRHP